MLNPVDDHGPSRAVEDEAGDAQGVDVGVHVRAHHDELVVGGTRHDVGLSPGHRQPAGHFARHLLGRPGPELLVHFLPAVELDEQHGQWAPGALGPGHCLVELLLDSRARLGGSAKASGSGGGGGAAAASAAAALGGGRRRRLGLGRHLFDDLAEAVVLDRQGPLGQGVANGLDERLGDQRLHQQPVEVGGRPPGRCRARPDR